MFDLFQAGDQGESLDLPDATLRYFSGALTHSDAELYFARLLEVIPWKAEEVVVWGKRHMQPRLIAWFGDAAYTYSGSTLTPHPWTQLLNNLRSRVEALSGAKFNSVLLNLYRDQSDRMGWHSDDESSLGRHPTIASLSLGSTRVFQMKHKRRPELSIFNIALASGSLLVMSGATQDNWMHSIRKETKHVGARINLTFRYLHT
jgi:alkylated DNA repair dioxygenase AlkB